MPKPFEHEIIAWVNKAQDMVNERFGKQFPTLEADRLEVSMGRKFAKIISIKAGHTSGGAWGFIDLSNGDVLKAESWKRPAPHARGNIFKDEPGDCCEWTGPRYLR